ncbi:MAG: aminotransferase class I/II-fold pyridoxal phosphate-dependent enzyme [Balneolaceae bacterium]|nr:aminotransferase class I/II-fold pyridoxal phosphate-dependent enzyme [Balneolaceae bacterium]
MSLDYSPEQFKKLISRSAEIIEEWYENGLRGSQIYRNPTPEEVRKRFDEPLPEAGEDPEKLLEIIREDVFETSNFNPSPDYYGYITGGGNQAATIAELLKSALNQNNLKWHSAPANTEMEKIVIRWICRFIGYPESSAGVLVSSGSVANFLNLAVMRKVKSPVDVAEEGLYSSARMTVYVSSEGHSSIEKGMDMLGMGKRYLRKIPVDGDFRIDINALEKAIEEDRSEGLLPVGVVGIAGTTNTGSVDPLQTLGEIAEKHNLWYIIDGAYGLPAAGTGLAGDLFDGLRMADALLINPHKWFYVPFEAACVIVKEKKHLKNTFSLTPDYLKGGMAANEREDLKDFNLQLTKDFKALKVWMTFKAYGAQKLREAIENDCRTARYARDRIEQTKEFELMAPVPLSIVCFRYLGRDGAVKGEEQQIDRLNDRLLQLIEEDGRIFFAGTKIRGRTALRINLTNHRRKNGDIDFLLNLLRKLGRKAEEDR